MAELKITLRGLSPLLMNRMLIDNNNAQIEKLNEDERLEFAKSHAYINKKGKYYLPGEALQRAIINGGAYSKGKGRATLARTVAAGVQVLDQEIPLDHDEPQMDTRLRVNPVTKGRTLVCRMAVPNWSCEVNIEYDENLLTISQLQEVLESSGKRVGLLDWRPEKKGQFGRFAVEFASTKTLKTKK